MAGEILLSNIGDLTVAQAASNTFLMMVADRRSLPQHPALQYDGPIDNMRSNVVKIGHVGLDGYDTSQQVAENGASPLTPLAQGSSLVAVVRYTHARTASDLSRIAAGGVINPTLMAQDAIKVHANRLTQLICDVIDGFVLTGGRTGQNMTVADYLAALGVCEVGNLTGPFMSVFHGQQWSDLITDLGVAASGTVQYMAAAQDMVQLRGDAFKGTFLGTDVFVSNRVNSNGADRQGAIFGPGSVIWKDATPPVDDAASQMMIGNKILFERSRSAETAETKYVSHAYLGASLGIQNGLTFSSDA